MLPHIVKQNCIVTVNLDLEKLKLSAYVLDNVKVACHLALHSEMHLLKQHVYDSFVQP
jgi:hypothetical protein